MRRFIYGLLVILTSVLVAVLTAEPSSATTAFTITLTPPPTPEADAPQPVVMLFEYDPWRMVLGSDMPSFALYDSGQVIYWHRDGNDSEFRTVMLDEDELAELLETLDLSDEFYELDEFYDAVMITDQPTNRILAWDEEHGEKSVSVYGDLRGNTENPRDETPDVFLNLYDAMIAFEHPDAERWTPDVFEVIVWDYATSDAVVWPQNWPGLDEAVERESVYSLYLPYEEYEAFLELVEGENALKIDGKTWAFSVRFPFPHETMTPK